MLFRSQEETRKIIATSNVHLSLHDIEIETHSLIMDVDKQLAWGTGNVVIKRGEDEFNSSFFVLDLASEKIILKDLALTITPPENKGNLFLKAQSLQDMNKHKVGYSGLITACDNPKHHHFLWAYKFKYYPDKKITLYGGILYNEFTFFPFNTLPPIPLLEVFPVPFYSYHIGKRKRVWNFPIMGVKEKEGWGFFVQNTIDYKHENKKDSSLYLDWFKGEGKGIGGGIKHHYQVKNMDGMLYYYNFDFKNKRSNTNWEEQFNRNIELQNTIHINPFFNIQSQYKLVDVDERINSSGEAKNEKKVVSINFDKFGNKYKLKTSEYQDLKFKRHSQTIHFSHSFNKEKKLQFKFNKQNFFSTSRQRIVSGGDYNITFPSNFKLKNSVSFQREENWSDKIAPDDILKTKHTLSKRFSKHLNMQVNINHMIDLDEQSVTMDSRSNRNDFLYKMPEINLNYSRKTLYAVNIKNTIQVARYQEAKYNSLSRKRRVYPESHDFNLVPNTYILKQELNKTIANPSANSSLQIKTGYDQYIFKSENKNLFEGDAIYALSIQTSFQKTLFNFLISNTSYKSSYAPEENNSPFYFVGKDIRNQNAISQSLTVYLQDQNKYAWSNQTSFDWILERWLDYTTTLKIKPNKQFSLQIQTGKKLNPKTNYEIENRFHPLSISSKLSPKKEFKINYKISFDLNQYIDNKITVIESSLLSFKKKLGKKKGYKWALESTFRYTHPEPENQKIYNLSHYEMETLSIKKKEHRRSISVGVRRVYIKNNERAYEYLIKYTLDAFPDDPLELSKDKDRWKLQGRFNKKSIERLK